MSNNKSATILTLHDLAIAALTRPRRPSSWWIHKEDKNISECHIVKNRVEYVIIADLEDGHILNDTNCSWSLLRGERYACSRVSNEFVLMHRIIAGAPSKWVVDHIDGNTFNNTKSNLRVTDQHINGMNRRKLNKNNKSGHRGVWYSRKLAKWVAEIRPNNKKITLGYFDEYEDACQAVKNFVSEVYDDCGF